MQAGRLDRRVRIEVKTDSRGEAGGVTETWSTAGRAWMGKRDRRAQESWEGVQVVAEIDTVFTARWSPAFAEISPESHRLVYRNRAYEIHGVVELGRREAVEIPCTARGEVAAPAVFSPAPYFQKYGGGRYPGAWWDFGDISSMYQDSSGTLPVTDYDQPVGRVIDKSGNGNHALQSTDAARPIVRNADGKTWLEFDYVDDMFRVETLSFSQPATTVAVARLRDAPLNKSNYPHGDQASPYTLGNFNDRPLIRTGATQLQAQFVDPSLEEDQIYRGVFNGSLSAYYIGRVEVLAGNIGTGGPDGVDIGYNGEFGDRLYEMMMIGRLLSDEEIALYEEYLVDKVGIVL